MDLSKILNMTPAQLHAHVNSQAEQEDAEFYEMFRTTPPEERSAFHALLETSRLAAVRRKDDATVLMTTLAALKWTEFLLRDKAENGS